MVRGGTLWASLWYELILFDKLVSWQMKNNSTSLVLVRAILTSLSQTQGMWTDLPSVKATCECFVLGDNGTALMTVVVNRNSGADELQYILRTIDTTHADTRIGAEAAQQHEVLCHWLSFIVSTLYKEAEDRDDEWLRFATRKTKLRCDRKRNRLPCALRRRIDETRPE